jgi:hypothetical protein
MKGFRSHHPPSLDFSWRNDRKPYMSANLSRPFRTAQVISFCSAPFGAHPSVWTRGLSMPSRTGPVKDGRRADRATLRLISRPLLDWPEHDGRLGRVGSRADRACPQQIEHPRRTASTRRISNNSRLPWLPVVKARSAGPASMSMGSCDDRITLYPAAPLRLATLLHARTIAREGWGSSTQRQIGKANSAMVFASHTSDPPNAHSKERRNR